MDGGKSYNFGVEIRSKTSSIPSQGVPLPIEYGVKNSECGADPIESSELEAAEVLACLADSVGHKNENLDSKSNWNIVIPTMPEFLDLATYRAEVVRQPCEKIYTCGNNSTQILTQTEKEERRMRRVLANRESARQTIRRKQVLYEELSKKAVDLARENENLKRKRETIMKDFDSLKSTNECLKAQIAMKMKTELEETPKESNSTHDNSKHDDISTSSSTNAPFLTNNQSAFMPVLWPSIVQSQDHPPQNVIPIPSMPDSFHEQEHPSRINGSGTLLYMFPYPWFFPLPNNGNRVHPQSWNGNRVYPQFSNIIDRHKEISMNNQPTASEVSSLLHGRPTNCLPATHPCRRGVFFMSPPVNSVRPTVAVLPKNDQQPDYTPRLNALLSMDGRNVNALPEKDGEPVNSRIKKLLDSTISAEARKRRKHLTKLKNRPH
ncbi:uncharacterized protein LOC132285151 [Cornus florida]|uniref:uncharacterized protein LOC132285151 n=1 Tax=Cornus florida TaxID=4283 RepID=UPI00289D342F|nr:uncharacterized protein LOC132285151 [Cornus florida]